MHQRVSQKRRRGPLLARLRAWPQYAARLITVDAPPQFLNKSYVDGLAARFTVWQLFFFIPKVQFAMHSLSFVVSLLCLFLLLLIPFNHGLDRRNSLLLQNRRRFLLILLWRARLFLNLRQGRLLFQNKFWLLFDNFLN